MTMEITGTFCPKVFCACSTKAEFVAVYTKLAQGNRAGLKDVEGYEIPKSGAIVYLTPVERATRLGSVRQAWGCVYIKDNNSRSRDSLSGGGYQEMTPEEVIGHDGPITGGGKEGAQ